METPKRISADEFLSRRAKTSGRASRLEPFRQDIKKLRQEGCSFSTILEFLRQNGVEVTQATFSVWLKRNFPELSGPPKKTGRGALGEPQDQP